MIKPVGPTGGSIIPLQPRIDAVRIKDKLIGRFGVAFYGYHDGGGLMPDLPADHPRVDWDGLSRFLECDSGKSSFYHVTTDAVLDRIIIDEGFRESVFSFANFDYDTIREDALHPKPLGAGGQMIMSLIRRIQEAPVEGATSDAPLTNRQHLDDLAKLGGMGISRIHRPLRDSAKPATVQIEMIAYADLLEDGAEAPRHTVEISTAEFVRAFTFGEATRIPTAPRVDDKGQTSDDNGDEQ